MAMFGKIGKIGSGGIYSLGAFMLFAGIADLPARFVVWRGWFTSWSPHLHTMTFRWILGILGIIVALSPHILRWFEPRVDVKVRPIDGPGTVALVVVQNMGADREFLVQCELTGLRNSPNELRNDRFTLKWDGSDDEWRVLQRNQSAKVVIATWEIKISPNSRFASMRVLEFPNKPSEYVEWAGWQPGTTDKLPEFDLRITIVGKGTRNTSVSTYTLRPKTSSGPLELVPVSE